MSDEALLSRLPDLTEQLGVEHVRALLDRMDEIELEMGSVIVHDQGPMDAFYLLLEGTLALSVEIEGHAILLGDLAPGNWVGEVAFLNGSFIACSTVTAATDVKLARLTYQNFEAMLAEDPVAACHLMHGFILMLSQRLRATANDPVLDPDGRLQIQSEMSVPWDELAQRKHGVLGFFKSLLGVQ